MNLLHVDPSITSYESLFWWLVDRLQGGRLDVYDQYQMSDRIASFALADPPVTEASVDTGIIRLNFDREECTESTRLGPTVYLSYTNRSFIGKSYLVDRDETRLLEIPATSLSLGSFFHPSVYDSNKNALICVEEPVYAVNGDVFSQEPLTVYRGGQITVVDFVLQVNR